MLGKRKTLDAASIAQKSNAICTHLREAGLLSGKKVFHIYFPIKNEVDTRPLIEWLWKSGATVVMSRSDFSSHRLRNSIVSNFKQLEPTVFGLREPLAALPEYTGPLDIVFVPGVAFDRRKNRLGYGAGFYDAFLAGEKARKIALAFACQLVESIPAQNHDIRMDLIVTENGVL